MDRKRENWIDNIKVIACVLVALGHLFQSFVVSDIISESSLYGWFNKTIYMFHVQLFFMCSGYLYQKYSVVNSYKTWSKSVLKKLIALGVPYFTFSTATWLLKTIFDGAVNTQAKGIVDTLFIKPIPPYWYLYALFFVFVVTPTFKSLKIAIAGLFVAVLLKFTPIIKSEEGIYAISIVMMNEFWFVLGMVIALLNFKQTKLYLFGGLFCVFIISSVVVYKFELNSSVVSFLLGLLACISIFGIVKALDTFNIGFFTYLAKYTMPIFLMHTIFAAACRSVLFKLGINTWPVHVPVGIVASFVAPIICAWFMKKTKYPEFFLYPMKFIKLK